MFIIFEAIAGYKTSIAGGLSKTSLIETFFLAGTSLDYLYGKYLILKEGVAQHKLDNSVPYRLLGTVYHFLKTNVFQQLL